MNELLEINPAIKGGKTVVKGTRITCEVLRGFYEAGEKIGYIAKLYNLTNEQVEAAIRNNEPVTSATLNITIVKPCTK